MPPRPKAKPAPKPAAASPQTWALNPMVSMVGMAGWSELMKENVQFASERLGKDMQAQRDMLSCRSPEDLLRLQTGYCQDTVAHYAKHFQRVTELLSTSTALGWSEATAPRARNYDDVPL